MKTEKKDVNIYIINYLNNKIFPYNMTLKDECTTKLGLTYGEEDFVFDTFSMLQISALIWMLLIISVSNLALIITFLAFFFPLWILEPYMIPWISFLAPVCFSSWHPKQLLISFI